MINPAQYQKVLGQISDEQLMGMLRRPDKIPSQFIVAEINRRQAMRQSAKANQAAVAQQMPIMPNQNIKRMPPQGQPMPRQPQQQQMQPRGMREGGMLNNAQQLSEISNQLSSLVGGEGQSSGNITNLLSNNGGGGLYNLSQPAYRPVQRPVAFPAQLFGGFDQGFNRLAGARGMNEGGRTLPIPKPSVGQRNNNPMNLRPVSGDAFFGTMGVSPRNYSRFSSDLAGLRAGFVNMATQAAQGVDTLNQYLGEYAPEGENSPDSVFNYKNFVADALGVGLNDKINLADPATQLKVADAQIRFENNRDDDYYKSLKPLLPKALELSKNKDDDPFVSERPQGGGILVSSADASTGNNKTPTDVMVGPDDANADYINNIRRLKSQKVLQDALSGLQSLGRKTPAIRDGRDSVGGGLDAAARQTVSGPNLQDLAASQFRDRQDLTTGNEFPGPPKRRPTGSYIEDAVSAAGPKVTSDDRRASRTGDGRSSDERYNPSKGLFQAGSGSTQNRRGNIVTNRGVLDNNPNEDGGSGIKPPTDDSAANQSAANEFLNLFTRDGPTKAKAAVEDAVGPTIANAAKLLIDQSKNNPLGDTALDGAFDIPTLKGDLAKLSAANQKLVEDYNTGAAELIKQRKELMEQFEGQRRTPQNMMFRALIDFGLELAASPEVNFTRALAQAGKAGIASFDNLNKENQQQLFRQYKMAYDIAAAEFDHKIKGQKLAVDTGMQAVTIADTLSQIVYRKQMGDAAIIKAQRTGQTGDGANRRALFNAAIKILDDPMAFDNPEIPSGYIIYDDNQNPVGVDRQRYINDLAAFYGIAPETIIPEAPKLQGTD
jgi:hypothetical protein